MEHIRYATYTVTSGTFDETVAIVRRPGGIAEKLRATKGFSQYGLADLGDGMFASVSVWTSRAAADAAVGTIAELVKDELSERIELTSNAVGDFAFLDKA